MRATGFLISIVIAVAPLAGCVGPEEPAYEGVTLGAGNAIAHNSALQIIDPWPPGVQDTDIAVPADRGDEDTAGNTEDGPQPTL